MSIDTHGQRESELIELNELLRGKVEQLEEKLWNTDQLRKVHSEKSFELEGKVRELEARNQKDFVWRGQEIGRLNDEVDELKEKLQVAEKLIAELSDSHSNLRETMAAIHNTIKQDGFATPLAVIMQNAKRAHEESAAAGITVKGE